MNETIAVAPSHQINLQDRSVDRAPPNASGRGRGFFALSVFVLLVIGGYGLAFSVINTVLH